MSYEGCHKSKGSKAAILGVSLSERYKAGRFLSSRSAWDTASLGPGVVEMVISGQGPTQLIYHQCLT